MLPFSRRSGSAVAPVTHAIALLVFASALSAASAQTSTITANPATMPRIATVDPRFQSFNIEMVEVTGGNFWKPYSKTVDAPATVAPKSSPSNQPIGMNPSMFHYRSPIDLSNARLRKLAAALGPTYVRVSGTWQNTTYFQDSDGPSPAIPPTGFNGVLTRQEWKGVVDFSNAVNAGIVTSFATSAGTRDANELWTNDQAAKFVAYTKSIGGKIAAAEFMNEPTMPSAAGAPKGYNGPAFGRDIAVFVPFLKKASPDTIILGPGSVGEGFQMIPANMGILSSEEMLTATGPAFDALSYHFYGGVSSRCATMVPGGGTTISAALTDDWLDRTDVVEAFYAKLRDRFEPGKKMWLTETAQTACGGDAWASTFLDSFRYLNQLGTLAQKGVQVVAHNTLAASDYALLDSDTFRPRPNYWAALLWSRFMGTTVLDPAVAKTPGVHTYAQCLKNVPGGLALLVINANPNSTIEVSLPQKSERYTLSSREMQGREVSLNGTPLALGQDDALPILNGIATPAGSLTLPPASITFLTLRAVNNSFCK